MSRNILSLGIILITAASLNLGTVRKKEDPILRTQTDPILYKEKMEEIKDGEKGAPSPSFKHYPKSGFLVDPSVEADKETGAEKPGIGIPAYGEPIPEDLSNEENELEEEAWVDDWEDDFGDSEEDLYENSFKNTSEMDEARK